MSCRVRQFLTFAVAAVMLAIALGSARVASAQDDGFVTVVLTEELTIRDVALQYLGDSDLWPEILRASNFESVADLSPGLEVRVPVSLVSAAEDALRLALTKIQAANEAGAQLFAPVLIAAAIDYRDEALVYRGNGVWEQTIELATQSQVSATEAHELSSANRNQAAEARLSDRQGRVEGQRPRELLWGDRNLNAILIEEERVRTLSDSTAQITFRDASRLRLNANSQAVIQRMRVDPVSNREEARVSLVEGDFYALLGGTSERSRFEVDIPDVDATIDSGNFWVSNKDDGARFTNYDDQPVRVAAQGEAVMLGRNEGTIVRPGERPQESFDVLTPPELAGPGDDHVLYTGEVTLTWNGVAGAEGYWLEVAHDPAFERMAHSRWGLLEPQFDEETFVPGRYYWRVAALDASGLPGARSAIWRFEVRVDEEPPYLRIEYPGQGDVLRDASVEIEGQSEPQAMVTVNGEAVAVDAQGAFRARVDASAGENEVHVVSLDPAGNSTELRRLFTYLPDADAVVRFDDALPRLSDDHFLTGNFVASLTGLTVENAQILVVTDAGEHRSSAYTDERGRFTLNIPMELETERFELQVAASSGFTSTQAVTVTIDREPPQIGLLEPLPRFTAESVITIAGAIEKGSSLAFNGNAVLLRPDGGYAFPVQLSDGVNVMEFAATDAVGNVKVEQWAVRVDRDPPELEEHNVQASGSGASSRLTIRVTAQDASGLAVVAPFRLEAGGRTYTGYLRYNRGMRGYQGQVDVPADAAEGARLISVELQDHAGNKQAFAF